MMVQVQKRKTLLGEGAKMQGYSLGLFSIANKYRYSTFKFMYSQVLFNLHIDLRACPAVFSLQNSHQAMTMTWLDIVSLSVPRHMTRFESLKTNCHQHLQSLGPCCHWSYVTVNGRLRIFEGLVKCNWAAVLKEEEGSTLKHHCFFGGRICGKSHRLDTLLYSTELCSENP